MAKQKIEFTVSEVRKIQKAIAWALEVMVRFPDASRKILEKALEIVDKKFE